MQATPDFDTVSTAELELSITRLCADINAATFQQLTMIAEFDRRQGWGGEGVRSCAHWLNWHCGISLTAAREKVRVAHALGKLPQTREAFAQGVLSYSKARAITRIGTASNEATLLSFARYGTASQLDKTVRLYRRQFNATGVMTAGYHQPVIEPDEENAESASDDERRDAENQGAMHHHEYRELSTQWDEHGCLQIRARLTPEQGAVVIKAIEAAVESLKQAEPKEEADSDEQTKSDKNTSAGACSAEKNRQYPRRRADALMLMANAYLKDTKVACNTDDRYQVVVHVDSQVLSQQVFESTSGKPDCYIEQQVALPVETARRLSCSCKVVTALTKDGEPMNIGRSTRAISTGIRRALSIRDGSCQFPGCDCHTNLDAHHIVHWANGGETSLSNLIHVCSYHHRLLHEGQFSVSRLADGGLIFKRPDGTPIWPGQGLSDKVKDIPSIDNQPWSWSGDSMDYSAAVGGIAYANRESARLGGSAGCNHQDRHL